MPSRDTPAHEEPYWDGPTREAPGRDGPFWEMPDTADEPPDRRSSGPARPEPVRREQATNMAPWRAARQKRDADPRSWRVWTGVGGGLLVGALSAVLVVLLGAEPDELTSTPREPEDGGVVVGDVRVELSPPIDRTDRVELSWHSTRELDFAVIVAAEGRKAEVHLAQRRKSMTVDVEPGLKYCFMVQGTDSDRVYESQPRSLRGATCRK